MSDEHGGSLSAGGPAGGAVGAQAGAGAGAHGGPGAPLAGRIVVVTGAAGGLGPAVVARLLGAGATCYLPVRRLDGAALAAFGRPDAVWAAPPLSASSPSSAEALADAAAAGRPPAGARVVLQPGVDLTDEAAVARFFAGLPALWASVHVAGGYAGAPIADIDLAAARRQLELNFITSFLCCREAVRTMRRAPVQADGRGRLVNVSSRAAQVPGGGAIAYAASKAAVEALTRSLAVELRDDRILVNAVAPGTIDTAANRAAMPAADASRWITPAAIAEAITFLVSPANTTVNGAVIPVRGADL